ncbi:cupin domain-containing protein [Candidatus Latescibacterota bacterium]
MKKIAIYIVLALLAAQMSAFAGDQPTVPSFEEFSDWSRRHPDTDTDLDLYHHSWKDSPTHIGHGGFIEQEILKPGDPMNPPECGAVLTCLKEYNHGFLKGSFTTESTTHEKLQVLFFVISGNGSVEAGGETADISEGTGVFMPAGITYQFSNTTETPMEFLIFSEEITEGFEPLEKMQIGSYHDNPPGNGQAWHWAHVSRNVISGGFANPLSFGVVTIDALDIAQPHVAPIGIEEIWFQLKGKSLMYFGNRLFWHEEGEAFYITPNYKVPHSSINNTDGPMMWVYLGIRLDRLLPDTPEKTALIESLTIDE